MGRRRGDVRALTAIALAGCTAGPTTWEDVAPRLERSCLPCHADPGADRPSFASLEDARAHAVAMRDAVTVGLMPPGGIDRSGACGTFAGPKPFDAADLQVLGAWIDAGMPAGPDRRETPPVRREVRVDRRLEVLLPLAAEDVDERRCLVFEDGPAAGEALAGVAVAGGGALHHAMVFTLPADEIEAARALDGADPRPGWSCPGNPLPSTALVFTWVPGTAEVALPDGAGVPLPGGPWVVQVHQHGRADGPGSLTLLLREAIDHAVRVTPIAASGFRLPAGEERTVLDRPARLPFPGDALLLGVLPHMHRAGRRVALAVEGGPCLVDAPRYDFEWQETALYEEPVALPAGARLSLTCAWDTRGRTSPVPWGESTDDEMCTVFLLLAAAP